MYHSSSGFSLYDLFFLVENVLLTFNLMWFYNDVLWNRLSNSLCLLFSGLFQSGMLASFFSLKCYCVYSYFDNFLPLVFSVVFITQESFLFFVPFFISSYSCYMLHIFCCSSTVSSEVFLFTCFHLWHVWFLDFCLC